MRAKEPAPETVDRKKRGPPQYQPSLTLGPRGTQGPHTQVGAPPSTRPTPDLLRLPSSKPGIWPGARSPEQAPGMHEEAGRSRKNGGPTA